MSDGVMNRGRRPAVGAAAWILLAAAFLAVYYPVMAGLIKAWYSSDDYSHGFFILPISFYMLWQNRTELSSRHAQGSWIGLPVIALALVMFLFGKFGAVATLTSVSMIVLVWGAVLFLFGLQIFRLSAFPLFFLLFMVPVPAQIYAALTNPLQFIVTKITVSMASMIGVVIYREGNVIHLSDITFQVVQACSGLRSIMTMLTLGAVFGYFTLRSLPMRLVLVAAGIPIAIVVNIFRVFTMILVYDFFKINLAEGTAHTALGLLVFALAFIIFLYLQKGLAAWER